MSEYDAIVVGARCAGAPTAMVLARRGWRVLLVDRATFPSDTVSTHLLHAPAIAALHRWGLLHRVVATGCPPINTYSFDFGPITISGTPRPVDGINTAYAPRRTVLDKILVDAAAEAGAEVREGFTVDEILIEDGAVVGIRGRDPHGAAACERARVVIGADGRNSHLARAVRAEEYNTKPILQWSYYTYWSGLPIDGMETVIRPNRGWGAFPTNDDLTLIVMGWPYAEASAYKSDVEANYLKTFELAPEFAARVREAKREARSPAGLSRITSASRTATAGRSSVTRAIPRTRSPPRASPMRSATLSAARMRSSKCSSGVRRSRMRCRSGNAHVTCTQRRSTNSPRISRRSILRHPRCNRFSARCTGTGTRWTISSAWLPRRSHRSSSSIRRA